MKDGQPIRFAGEGDQEPGIEAGDVVVVLDEREHSVFKRKGNDLVLQMELQLVEALCGFQRPIQTLSKDKRVLVITCLPGEVFKHGEFKVIFNEGMVSVAV